MADFRGVYLAMQTPFAADGAIDLKRTEVLIDSYIDCGIHGFVISSGTGQHPYLEEEEWQALVKTSLRHLDGRRQAIVQTSALNMKEVIRRCRFAEDHGAAGVMILPPYLEGPSDDDGLLAFYAAIDTAINIDIVGYNIPGATQIEIGPQLYARLLQLEHFRYIKDSSSDFGKQQKLISIGGRLLNGADMLAPYSFMAGAYGCIWGGANYMPRQAVRLYNLVTTGAHVEAMTLWAKMFPSLHYLWFNDYIAAVKTAATIMGFDGGPVRAPVRTIGPEAEKALRATLAPLLS